jgi:DNA polymerase III subunit alpha
VANFVHLHNHSHFSLLDGACRIDDLVSTAVKYEMPALALTDHGTLFGAVEFYQKCKLRSIKPIIGSEVYVAPRNRFEKKQIAGISSTSYHLVLLCKNDIGYKNLMRLVSKGFLEGFYYKPRVDKELLRQYSQGLVALSACLKGEIAATFLHQGEEAALQILQEYVDIFKEDFYLEVQKHHISDEDKVFDAFHKLSSQTGVKIVATNDIHYLLKEHWAAHDVLLCLQTGKDFDDPDRLRYNTHELYFKDANEMRELFKDTPEVLDHTIEVVDKCNLLMDLKTYHLPYFKLPPSDEIKTLDQYLERLAYVGLQDRYTEITLELKKRLNEELEIIKQMDYAGYFLITFDFIRYARKNGIAVGPGRGSAAGSLVAYCLHITDLDPLRYGLYFERFLNPERISMPDIDIDFCYERREEVIDYVKKKYGSNNVCQIITFGTMAARAVIRDVGRVLKMSYSDVDRIAKLVPAQLNIKLEEALKTVPELRELENKDEQHKKLMEYSRVLEGLARHASTHAAGVVITPEELTNYVPLYVTKDNDVTTQFDMKSLEKVGLLKMDFLGLRTLTVIQKTLDSLKTKGIQIDLDNIPMDDPRVYEFFANGKTIGIFQFESSGMQEYLKKLQPTCIEDLIAMNALYRPGPMTYIDDFINRKKGRTPIVYLHPRLEPILKETYGIIVYQEQVMAIASQVGGYSLGGADLLRRAMGKKIKEIMEQQRPIFIEGAGQHGVSQKVSSDIWQMMDKFADYGFNKAHAACYSVIAYHTAYLKAYHPADFMAATISSEMGSSNRVTILLEECRQMGIQVLPPDVNESFMDFIVTGGAIRFGLGAVKNVGRNAVEAIVSARLQSGKFKTIYDLAKNVESTAVNKKVLESLIEAGAMDSLEGTRAQLFEAVQSVLDFAHRTKAQAAHGQTSMFDSMEDLNTIVSPMLANIEDWSQIVRLNREKNSLGFYLSGHPLDRYREEIKTFATVMIEAAGELPENATVRICGIVADIKMHMDRQKRPMAFFKIEDFTGSLEGIAFADTYEKYREQLAADAMVMVIGKVNTRESDAPKILADEIITLSEARKRFTKSLCLNLESTDLTESLLYELKVILENFQGDVPFFINLKVPDAGTFMLKSRSVKVTPGHDLIEQLRQKVGRTNVWVGN